MTAQPKKSFIPMQPTPQQWESCFFLSSLPCYPLTNLPATPNDRYWLPGPNQSL